MTGETAAFANAMIFDGVSAELREGCVRVAAGVITGVGGGPSGIAAADATDGPNVPTSTQAPPLLPL